MAEKYHVSADGNPHKCFAEQRACPLGGEENHYSSLVEARAGYEASMADQLFPSDGRKGFAVVASGVVGPDPQESFRVPPTKKLKIKRGFSTPQEAIDWAKENIADSTQLITVENEDWQSREAVHPNGEGVASGRGNPVETGDFHTLNLIDISEDRQVIDSQDVPTIGKHWIKKYGKSITDEHSLRVLTGRIAPHVDRATLNRIRAYVRTGTFGRTQ